MKIFISGGCKNGKSTYAQKLAKWLSGQVNLLYYIATMTAVDKEDLERIARHQKEREGWDFTTIEQPRNIQGILSKCDCNGIFLVDSITALLANEMFSVNGDYDETACQRTASGLSQVLDKLDNIVIVSDYIYSDAFLYDPITEAYRKSLATLDKLVAEKCDLVLEVAFGQTIIHKARWPI